MFKEKAKVKMPKYKIWLLWTVFAIFAIIVAIIGLSSSPADNANSDNLKPATQPVSKPASTPVKQTNDNAHDKQAASDLKAYFDNSMSESSWYKLIKSYSVSGDNVVINTSEPLDGKDNMNGMSSAVWGFTNQNGSKYSFKHVTIYGENGHMLISQDNPTQ